MFLVVTVIVLMNLLIAMMSDTYANTNENAAIVMATAVSKSMLDYQRLPCIPPPLNLVCVPFRVLAFVCSCVLGDTGGNGVFSTGLVRYVTDVSVASGWRWAWSFAGGDKYVVEEKAKSKKVSEAKERIQRMASENIAKRNRRVAVVQRYVHEAEHARVQSHDERLKRIARDIRVLDVEMFGGGRQLRNHEQLVEYRRQQMEPQRLW